MANPLLTLLIYETILTITSLPLLIDDRKYTGDGNVSKYLHVSLPNSVPQVSHLGLACSGHHVWQ